MPPQPGQVCCGARHCIAVGNGGLVYSWGWSGLGAIGVGRQDKVDVVVPELITSLAGVVKVVQVGQGNPMRVGSLEREQYLSIVNSF